MPDANDLVWNLVTTAMKVSNRVLLWGPPGVGKTYTAMHSPGSHKTTHSVTLTEETPAAELRGHYIPKGNKFVWTDGPAITAWRNGDRLVLNEIGEAGADLLTFLYAICDDPEFARITLPTGEMVKPEEGFQVIATTNEPPEVLSAALRDRFIPTIHIFAPPTEALDQFSHLRDAVKETTNTRDQGAAALSLRQWLAFKQFSSLLPTDDLGIAAELAFGKKIALDLMATLEIAKAVSSDGWTQNDKK